MLGAHLGDEPGSVEKRASEGAVAEKEYRHPVGMHSGKAFFENGIVYCGSYHEAEYSKSVVWTQVRKKDRVAKS